MTIEIRPQHHSDRAAVRRVLTDAFADTGRVADLSEALVARSDARAALVAVDGDRIVGQTQLSVSWLDAPQRLVEVLTLSPLAVTPDRQSAGIGARLVAAAITAAGDLRAPLIFLEGDPHYYSRHGWLAAAELGFTRPSTRIPAAGFQVRTLSGYDARAMTGAVVYNDTFWSQDCVGLRP